MKFSIITVNYNNRAGLDKTISSVLQQKFHDFEYIVIDGGSIDGSKEIIQTNANIIDYWVCERDLGVYDAMNKGIKNANGDYFLFLNSGDYLVSEDVLTRLSGVLNESDTCVYYCNVNLLNSDGTVETFCYPPNLTLGFWEGNTINHQSSLISRQAFEKFGLYSLYYKIASDYEFFLKLFCAGIKFNFFNGVIVNYANTGISTSNYDLLVEERSDIWNKVVPTYARDMFSEIKTTDKLHKRTIVRYALALDSLYQRLRRKLS